MNLDLDWSEYRWVTDWGKIRPGFVSCRLAYAEFLIPQCVTEDNVYEILKDVRENLAEGFLSSLAEWVNAMSLDIDFRGTEFCERISFLDQSCQLTPHYRKGMEILQRIQREQPNLLPIHSR